MAQYPTAAGTDANLFVAVNNLSTSLTDNPLTSGATTVNVASTTGFPTTGFITIEAEAIQYTGVTGTSFTGCTRGADGTTSASHVTALQVYHNIVAAHRNVVKDELKAIETDLVAAQESKGSVATNIISKLNKAGGTMSGAIAMGSNKVTGLAAASVAGDALRYEQLFSALVTLGGSLGFTSTSSQGIVGSTTNDSAAAGNVGQYVQSYATGVSGAATGVYVNVTSISLTAGDWDVSGVLAANNTVVTPSGNTIMTISAFSGNTATDHVLGDNQCYGGIPSTGGAQYGTFSIPCWRVSISSTTTIYLKGSQAYSAGTPSWSGRISARRVR